MPTLHWIGKDKVINHHLDVPYKVLDHQYGFDNGVQSENETSSGNKIIHGDNLEALKSLLPEYEGKIKCIYIDPPYNTGNEGWVYNDNVNDPKIKRWLNEVVGKEGEDLSRHDKWLCMMYPRLKLLHKLLAENGAIFISIDDNEQANLKLILDEIFGIGNFVTDLIWRSADSSNNDAKQFSTDHNHTLVYSKTTNWQPIKLVRSEENNAHYKNPDNDPNGSWFSGNLSSPNPRPNLSYQITTPNGNIINPPKNGWRWKRERVEEMLVSGEMVFSTDQTRVVKKTYLKDQSGIVPSSIWWDVEETGHNRNAKYELIKIFHELTTSDIFKTPKPTKFIEKILAISTDSNDIILDSFAGSGTTAHSVINVNNLNGGTRKFILIEMEEYAETITSERIRRVINGYSDKPRINTGFDYYHLGEPLFTKNDELNEAVGVDKLRNYIYYTETNHPLIQSSISDNEYFLDVHNQTSYYFYYQSEELTALDDAFLSTIKTKAEQYIIYADNCLLNADFMKKHNIIFKKIPRDITKF